MPNFRPKVLHKIDFVVFFTMKGLKYFVTYIYFERPYFLWVTDLDSCKAAEMHAILIRKHCLKAMYLLWDESNGKPPQTLVYSRSLFILFRLLACLIWLIDDSSNIRVADPTKNFIPFSNITFMTELCKIYFFIKTSCRNTDHLSTLTWNK